MARGIALFVLLTSCTAEQEQQAKLTCTVFSTCGDTGPGSFGIEFNGDDEKQVEQEARDWVEACGILTNYKVIDGECPYVWCGALCVGEASAP